MSYSFSVFMKMLTKIVASRVFAFIVAQIAVTELCCSTPTKGIVCSGWITKYPGMAWVKADAGEYASLAKVRGSR